MRILESNTTKFSMKRSSNVKQKKLSKMTRLNLVSNLIYIAVQNSFLFNCNVRKTIMMGMLTHRMTDNSDFKQNSIKWNYFFQPSLLSYQ